MHIIRQIVYSKYIKFNKKENYYFIIFYKLKLCSLFFEFMWTNRLKNLMLKRKMEYFNKNIQILAIKELGVLQHSCNRLYILTYLYFNFLVFRNINIWML